MDMTSLHPFPEEAATRFVSVLHDASGRDMDSSGLANPIVRARASLENARAGSESGANAITVAFATDLASREPTFVGSGVTLSHLEAMIDRGVGLLLRPPSRLFEQAGLDRRVARTMPIRIDPSGSMMGGAYMPARLVPQFGQLLRDRRERLLRRLRDADHDPVAVYGLLVDLAEYAGARGFAIYEAAGAVTPELAEALGQPVVFADRSRMDRALVRELDALSQPPKQGLLSRLTGRNRNRAVSEPDADW